MLGSHLRDARRDHGDTDADTIGLQLSYLLPAACYVYVLFYAVWGCRVSETLPDEELTTNAPA